MTQDVFILAAQRTPVGAFQGALANVSAPELGATAIQAALQNAKVDASAIEECVMGQVLTAGVGQAPARQAALKAGLPHSVPCTTINKVCGSGLKAVMLAADSIALGRVGLAVAGGQENMSLAPHLLENSRSGYRMGPITASDSMVKDGLWDPYNQIHMGSAAELCVKEYRITREAQDEFAKQSYLKAQKAVEMGRFKNEICGVTIADKKTSTTVLLDDEPGRARFDKMTELRAAFEKDGTITAANASKINDGGAALVLGSEAIAKTQNVKPLARIVAGGTFAHDPKWFTTAPVNAMKRALTLAQLKAQDIDLYEINEAFSVVTMVATQELGIDPARVNVYGGAVAIGHPIGASGARILTTLVHALHSQNKRYGMASLCIGGGEGIALIVERL